MCIDSDLCRRGVMSNTLSSASRLGVVKMMKKMEKMGEMEIFEKESSLYQKQDRASV